MSQGEKQYISLIYILKLVLVSLHGLITTDESWTLFVPYEKHVFVIDFYLLEGEREKERKKEREKGERKRPA